MSDECWEERRTEGKKLSPKRKAVPARESPLSRLCGESRQVPGCSQSARGGSRVTKPSPRLRARPPSLSLIFAVAFLFAPAICPSKYFSAGQLTSPKKRDCLAASVPAFVGPDLLRIVFESIAFLVCVPFTAVIRHRVNSTFTPLTYSYTHTLPNPFSRVSLCCFYIYPRISLFLSYHDLLPHYRHSLLYVVQVLYFHKIRLTGPNRSRNRHASQPWAANQTN